MEEDTDINAWIGKVPGNTTISQDVMQIDVTRKGGESISPSPSVASESTDEDVIGVDIPHRPAPAQALDTIDELQHSSDYRSSSSEGSIIEVSIPIRMQQNLSIDVPELNEDEKNEFEYLPGHFHARKVLVALPNHKYLVRLASGEVDLVERTKLTSQLYNGKIALNEYNKLQRQRGAKKPRQPPMLESGSIDWNRLDYTESEWEDGGSLNKRRKTYVEDRVSDLEPVLSSDDNFEDTDDARPQGRRSNRLVPKTRSMRLQQEVVDILSSDEDILSGKRPRRRGRMSKQQLKEKENASRNSRQLRALRDASSEEEDAGARRSERTRQQPKRNMKERNEDDLSSQSEKDLGPKIVATKEVFAKIPLSDPFRRRHQQECSTCYHVGDNDLRGPLVFCQGCSNSYHKRCLGPRGSRDHLVTKVGDELFALQCRKCIGVAREKDPSAPHYGRCSGCDKLGQLSKPLRNRLTTRQEQIQRDENGGIDPITITQPGTINNLEDIMFRCATCSRAWHMHHLPYRKTAHSQPGDSDEEGMADSVIAQKRFELYHRSWICKDCVENQHTVATIVAWRPTNQDNYVPGTTMEQMPEFQKEYLLKWKNQSYLRCTWMPGTWVWGIVAGPARSSFVKKSEHQLPRMTNKDAIPEEYHRIDIVFDVRYTSVVRNSSEGIDLARVKEVDTAYVKYKGLGYEDAIWEKPPGYLDTERFKDFKEAYEDFVRKKYMSIPPQSTLRRTLGNARMLDFETKLIKKTQPSIMTGGQMMQYQLEGHNWLFYQWYRQHNAILADEMGLGKTIQLIALIATLIEQFKCWPFLIVVPNSTCPNWRREIKKWIPSLRAVCYYGSHASRKLTHDYELFPKDSDETPEKKKKEVKDIKAHIVIASYESVIEKTTQLSLLRVPWQGLIVDEGQRLKNDKNLVYEGLAKFRFPFKVLMTGTPLQNNARELFNLIQFLDKDKHNAAQLEAKYAELTQENVPELHELLKPYFLRRTKVQVLTFLPPMSQVILPVSMTALQKKVSKSIMSQNPQLMKSIFSRDGNLQVKERTNLNNILMQLRKTLCHPFVYSREIEDRSVDSDTSFKRLVEASPKLQLLSIMLPKLKERGHRVLLFSQFLHNLDIIEDFLDGLGMLHRRLDGTINALEKQKRIDEFNAPDSPYFAFLLSTRAGGVGINLATADTVIILDPDFNPHQDIQALSRSHRIGQRNKVLVFQLMTRGTVEEKIMQIGKKKMALDHVLIEAMDQDDEAGMDLESILRHGATALFDEDEAAAQNDIVYTDASVDPLLDRSQVESTKTSEKQSAESQFSFARIWANDKATLEEGLKDSEDSGMSTPNPGIWDKILKERERAYEEEAARKAEELGRGKRRRGQVDYGGKLNKAIDDSLDIGSSPVRGDGKNRDDENVAGSGDEEFLDETAGTDFDDRTTGEETEPERQTVRGRPFKRVKVPAGDAPHFNGDPPAYLTTPNAGNGFVDYTTVSVPPLHKCSACSDQHPMGWCRLKIAGVEHCGLCGLAHMGHGRTCPHLNNEQQVETLLMTLKDSTESLELIDEATRYLRMIRGDLITQRRIKEKQIYPIQERKSVPAPGPPAGPFSVHTNLQQRPAIQPTSTMNGSVPNGINGYKKNGVVSMGVPIGNTRPA